MPKQSQFSAKSLKHTLFVASNDLNFALQPMVNELICCDVPKEKILTLVGTAAQRSLYLKMTDLAADRGEDLPVYKEAKGTPMRRLVDAEALRCATRLYKDTLIVFPERIASIFERRDEE
jgi:hypothetical protein